MDENNGSVFVVLDDEYRPVLVFNTREKADAYVLSHSDFYVVEEFELG